MIKFQTIITYPGKTPKGMRKAFEKARELANKAMGEVWFNEILPKHFERDAIVKYFYQPRTAKYTHRKKRKFGHENPLVYTGQAKAVLMSGYTIKSSPRRVEVKLKSPRAFNLSTAAHMPNMKKEVSRIIEEDLVSMAKAAHEVYKTEIEKSKQSQTALSA